MQVLQGLWLSVCVPGQSWTDIVTAGTIRHKWTVLDHPLLSMLVLDEVTGNLGAWSRDWVGQTTWQLCGCASPKDMEGQKPRSHTGVETRVCEMRWSILP